MSRSRHRPKQSLSGGPLTADDVLPIVAKLSREERSRLLQLLDAQAYAVNPVQPDEFSTDQDDLLALDADGWEAFK